MVGNGKRYDKNSDRVCYPGADSAYITFQTADMAEGLVNN